MNNINPKLWGSPAWDFLYYVTLSYPDNPTQVDKQNMETFLTTMGKILPCETCRNNYVMHTTKHKLCSATLQNRYHLVNWLININNEINLSHGKQFVTYDSIINKYLYKHSYNMGEIYSHLMVPTLIFLIIIVLIVYIKMRQD